MSRPADVGHFIVAIKPDLFMTLDEFRQRMDVLYRSVVDADKAHGVSRIYFTGEPEQIREEERRKTGIPYDSNEVATLDAEAQKLGVAELKRMWLGVANV